MEEAHDAPPNPNPTPPPPQQSSPAPPAAASAGFLRRPPIRVTSEFDSKQGLFSHRLSCRVLDGLAKLRLRLDHDRAGAAPPPQIALLSEKFSVVVDAATRSVELCGAAGSSRLRASHKIKEQQGEVAITANLGHSPCKLELSSLVPPGGLPRATVFFPNGKVSVEEKKMDEGEKILSVNGLMKSRLLNGDCTVIYKDNAMDIKYHYKDDELSFIPSISLPSNAISFAFKRRFTPSDKLSYWYHFDTNYWSAIYKHNVGKLVKWKAGYESDKRLGWSSLLVGDAAGKAKASPRKMKVECTLQVPQGNIQNSVVFFHVKKRWDF